jgi:hypothetical protein
LSKCEKYKYIEILLPKKKDFIRPNVRKKKTFGEFFLPHLQYRQIWLNMLMDGGYLSNITKLKAKITERKMGKKEWQPSIRRFSQNLAINQN